MCLFSFFIFRFAHLFVFLFFSFFLFAWGRVLCCVYVFILFCVYVVYSNIYLREIQIIYHSLSVFTTKCVGNLSMIFSIQKEKIVFIWSKWRLMGLFFDITALFKILQMEFTCCCPINDIEQVSLL